MAHADPERADWKRARISITKMLSVVCMDVIGCKFGRKRKVLAMIISAGLRIFEMYKGPGG